MVRRLLLRAALLLAVLLPATPAMAWWEYGHGAVGRIAYLNVSPQTRARVDRLLRQGRPLVKSDVDWLRRLAAWLNEPKSRAQLTELLGRLPESMTDQTRTGTYGSWYNYYVCGFSGRITLPAGLGTIPGVRQLIGQLNNLDFHSTAPRCNQPSAP